MPSRLLHPRVSTLTAVALLSAACAEEVIAPNPVPEASPLLSYASWNGGGDDRNGGAFRFAPLPTSAVCGSRAAAPERPFELPPGFEQVAFAREGDGGTRDLWDMHTQNETGVRVGRYLYRTHETGTLGQVSVTDLKTLKMTVGGSATSETRVIAERADWERFDGIVWTPWETILAAEEVVVARAPDPHAPQARAGLVYELFIDRRDPSKLDPSREKIVDKPGQDVDGDGTIDIVKDGIRVRPAVGSRSHEGLRFDPDGNLYGISEASPPTGGYIYKFVPDRRGDLGKGQLYALKIVESTGDRTGKAVWVPLDRAQVQIDSDVDATAKQATGYGRPEDVETATSTGRFDPWVLFVAITSEDRVVRIDLDASRGRGDDDDDRDDRRRANDGSAYVSDYVRAGVNAPADFENPDNLALDKAGNLYVAEDNGPGDIWVAVPGHGKRKAAEKTVRFASLSDCAAEPSGIYFDVARAILYVTVQHRGQGGTQDLSMMILPTKNARDDDEEDGEF